MVFEWTQEMERRLCEKMCDRLACYSREEGRASIFVAEEIHVTMLHRHLCLAYPARKSWEAILGSRYFGPAKGVKESIRLHELRTCGSRSRDLRGARVVKNGVGGCRKWQPLSPVLITLPIYIN